ncbi:GNAT family N-acetyltransferase [Nocardioidaceae bacterium]|nr:GNAT family N-acetyltransferase [Nocardioidaceae bacterium]
MLAHGLGPHIVGQRVVLRRLVPGEVGPTGGPAFTDVLGVLEAWDEQAAVVRSESGVAHRVPVALVVSGKPVPPRPSTRLRLDAVALQHAAARSFPARTREPLGAWLLRDDEDEDPHTRDRRRVARRTSALAVGDPGIPLGDAVAEVERWYAARGRHPWASVVEDSPAAVAFADAGWTPARRESPTETWVGSVSRALRLLRAASPPRPSTEVALARTVDPVDEAVRGWSAEVAAPEGSAYPSLASGRVVVDPAGPETVGLLGLTTTTRARRQGLSRAVLVSLLDAVAESGARTLWLHVLGDSDAARSLYASAGLVCHHRAIYLTSPA